MERLDMKPDFNWDPKKAQSNYQKHHVQFEEAATIFEDSLFITVVDKDHSDDEERYISVGISARGRLLLVAHTDRGDNIRIISARKATKNEEKFYQEAG